MKTSTLKMIAILATVASLMIGDVASAKNFGGGGGSKSGGSSSHSSGVSKSSGSSSKSSGTFKSGSSSSKSSGSAKTGSNSSKTSSSKTTSNGNQQNGSNSNKTSKTAKTDSSKTAGTTGKKTSGSNGSKQSKTDSSKTAGNSNGKNGKHDSSSKHDHHGCFSDFFCSTYCCPSYGCYSDYSCCPSYCESYCEPVYCVPSYCEESAPVYGDQVAPVYGDQGAPVAGGQAPVAGGDQAPVSGQTANVGQAFEPFHSTYNTLPGDSFFTVSLKEYGTSAKAGAIAQFNGMSADAALVPGQQLVLPSIAADGTLSESSSPVAESFASPANNTAAAGSVPATPASFTTAAGSDDEEVARTKVPAGSTLLVDGQNFGDKPGSARLQIGGGFLKIAVAQWSPNAVKVSLPKADQAGSTDAELEIVRADGSIASRTSIEVDSAEAVASNN
jgi:hypothetical protein